jgi:hypothetical protein
MTSAKVLFVTILNISVIVPEGEGLGSKAKHLQDIA